MLFDYGSDLTRVISPIISVVRASFRPFYLVKRTANIIVPLNNREYGIVFTRPWIVELMLDTCGYTARQDLANRTAVEPSCGDGAFLMPMIRRLSTALKHHGRSLSEASDALRAFDLHPNHVSAARAEAIKLLRIEGWPQSAAEKAVKKWIVCADYLLQAEPVAADYVIGNPPYIRSEDMPLELRTEYMQRCRTMTVGADIFVGFIEAALRSLNPNGVLSFICADRWMHNAYGKKLRGFVVDGFSVEAIWEMHGVKAFTEEVSAYPAVTQIRRAKQGAVTIVVCNDNFNKASATRLLHWNIAANRTVLKHPDFRADVLPHWFNTDDIWPSASPERLAVIEQLEDRFQPIESERTGTTIGIGLATGADNLFITHDPDLVEEDRLLPLAVTDHVRKTVFAWTPTYLINPWNEDGSLINLDDYPRTQAYFEPHRKRLSARHTARKSSETAWYRTIDKVNATLTGKPKLLFQDMKATIQPVYESGGHYPHHNIYWITSECWDLEVLGGLLLSEVAEMFVRAYGVKMRGGTLRFQCQYLRKIRVPNPSEIAVRTAERLANAFRNRDTREATAAALIAYGLDSLPE